jgi:hypothetical protein
LPIFNFKRPVIVGQKSQIANRKLEIGKMDTTSKYFRLRRNDIAYFKFIIESHEGMAVVRTKDSHEAIVELMVAPGWERDVDKVLEGLGKEIRIEPISLYLLIILNSKHEIPAFAGAASRRQAKFETSTHVRNARMT